MRNQDSSIKAVEGDESPVEKRMKDKVWRRVRGLELTADEKRKLGQELSLDEHLVREVVHGRRMAYNAISLADSIQAAHLHALGGEFKHPSIKVFKYPLREIIERFLDIQSSIDQNQRDALRTIFGDCEKVIRGIGNIELCLDRKDLARAVGLLVSVQKKAVEVMIRAQIGAESMVQHRELIEPLVNEKDGLLQKCNERIEELSERIQDSLYVAATQQTKRP